MEGIILKKGAHSVLPTPQPPGYGDKKPSPPRDAGARRRPAAMVPVISELRARSRRLLAARLLAARLLAARLLAARLLAAIPWSDFYRFQAFRSDMYEPL